LRQTALGHKNGLVTDEWTAPGADDELDATVPHSARIWNYWLGGKDNFEVDRAAGDAWAAIDPTITVTAREARAFLQRVVRFLAGEAGIRQFLDIGTGLPTADNTHEVAQRIAPDARIVYVDNDPLVLAHARALLISTPEGSTKYLHADMHDADGLIEAAAEILDLTEPVAVLFMGVLGHIADLDEARTLVRSLLDRVPSGSYLAIDDSAPTQEKQKAQEAYTNTGAVPYLTRQPEEIASFFDGLEWVEPGFVSITLWRPDRPPDGVAVINSSPMPISTYGGVARKP
jgi:O-methyltransferase involved in polyketide biosynthesis